MSVYLVEVVVSGSSPAERCWRRAALRAGAGRGVREREDERRDSLCARGPCPLANWPNRASYSVSRPTLVVPFDRSSRVCDDWACCYLLLLAGQAEEPHAQIGLAYRQPHHACSSYYFLSYYVRPQRPLLLRRPSTQLHAVLLLVLVPPAGSTLKPAIFCFPSSFP